MPEQLYQAPFTMMKMMLPPPNTTNPTTRNNNTPATSNDDGSEAAAIKPLVAPQNSSAATTFFASMPPPPPSPRTTSAGQSNLTRHTSTSSVGTFSLFDTQELLHEHLFQSTETTRRDDALLRNLMQTKQDSLSFASLGTLPSLSSDGSNGVSAAAAASENSESIPTPVKDAATALVEMTTSSTTTMAEPTGREMSSLSAAAAPFATTASFSTAALPSTTTTASLFNSSTWTKSLQPTHVDVDYGKIFPEQIRPASNATTAAAASAPQTKTATDFLNIFLNQLPPPMVPPPPLSTTNDTASSETVAVPAPLTAAVAPPTTTSLRSATTTVPTATKAFTPLPTAKNAAAVPTSTVVVPMALASFATLGPRRAPARATTKRPVAAAVATTDAPDEGHGEIIPFDQVTERDVLLGRGGRTNHHAGNIRYLAEKEKLQESYLSASKDDKTGIAQQLVDAINKDGGRFLKLWEDPSQVSTLLASTATAKSKRGGALDAATAQAHSNAATFWFEVDNLTARKKASQTLREINTAENRAAKRAKYTSTSSTKTRPR
jgi:hypothetical protein